MQETQVYAVLGDIGGTNVRLQLVQLSKTTDRPVPLKQQFRVTNEHPSIEGFLQDFLQEFIDTPQYPKYGVIAIAGPIVRNTCIMGNTEWPKIDGFELSKILNIPNFRLINDFESIGYSLLALPKQDQIILNQGRLKEGAPIGIMGPGTGLGVCHLISSHRQGQHVYDVFPGEGGHTTFSPQTEQEWQYLQFIQKKYSGSIITLERCFAGPALPDLFQFLRQSKPERESTLEKEVGQGNVTGKLIVERALNKSDEVCVEVIDLFLTFYGREVGNLGLRLLNLGGVYLVGGLSIALKEKLLEKDGVFLKEYFNHRMNHILEDVRVTLVNEPDLGLLGSFVEATRLYTGIDNIHDFE